MFKKNSSGDEEVFYRVFIKFGINKDEAVKASKIMASKPMSNLYTPEERQIVHNACRELIDRYQLKERISKLEHY